MLELLSDQKTPKLLEIKEDDPNLSPYVDDVLKLRQTKLEKLPNEILANISSKLPFKDLGKLQHTSSRFRDVAYYDMKRRLKNKIIKINDVDKVPERYNDLIRRVEYEDSIDNLCKLERFPNLEYIEIPDLEEMTTTYIEATIKQDCFEIFKILYAKYPEDVISDYHIVSAYLLDGRDKYIEYLENDGANPFDWFDFPYGEFAYLNRYADEYEMLKPEHFHAFKKLYYRYPSKRNILIGRTNQEKAEYLEEALENGNTKLVEFYYDILPNITDIIRLTRFHEIVEPTSD